MSDEEMVGPVGPCCACRHVGLLRNIIMLHWRNPNACGWGCVTCNLAPEGAIALVCDACWEGGRPIRDAVATTIYAADRVPVTSLTEPWDHDEAKHSRDNDFIWVGDL
jgi:hypothetical protein